MKLKRLLSNIYIRGLESEAFMLQTFKLPKFPHEKAIRKLYRQANRVRVRMGQPAKPYFVIKKRKLVRVEGT